MKIFNEIASMNKIVCTYIARVEKHEKVLWHDAAFRMLSNSGVGEWQVREVDLKSKSTFCDSIHAYNALVECFGDTVKAIDKNGKSLGFFGRGLQSIPETSMLLVLKDFWCNVICLDNDCFHADIVQLINYWSKRIQNETIIANVGWWMFKTCEELAEFLFELNSSISRKKGASDREYAELADFICTITFCRLLLSCKLPIHTNSIIDERLSEIVKSLRLDMRYDIRGIHDAIVHFIKRQYERHL